MDSTGCFHHNYTVKELSFQQAQYLFDQKKTEESSAKENFEQWLNTCHSYRTPLDTKNRRTYIRMSMHDVPQNKPHKKENTLRDDHFIRLGRSFFKKFLKN